MGVQLSLSELFLDDGGAEKFIQKIDRVEKATVESLQGMEKQALETAEALKKLSPSAEADQKKIEQLTSSIAELREEQAKLLKQLEALRKARKAGTELTDKQIRQRVKIQESNRTRAADIRREIRAQEAQAGSIAKLRAENNKLVQDRDRLNLQTIGGRREFERLSKVIAQNEVQLKKYDAQIGRGTRNVGRYAESLKGATVQFNSLLSAFGVATGIFGFVRVIQNATKIIVDFQQSNANLAAVLGTTRDNIKRLTDSAVEYGSATVFTATQVSELQTAFARLGFTQEEILGVTESTLDLAAAFNADLGESAELVGSALRAFGENVNETQRFVDVLAKSTTISALSFEKLQTALAIVAPVANSANVSVEKTTSLLSVLADAGLDASTAGTGLRNVFLEISKRGLTLNGALQKIQNATDKNSAALELFGKRGATIGTILADNTEKINENTAALEDSAGAAEAIAEEQLNTLEGAYKLLTSAWEGYILSLDNGTGFISTTLTGALRFLAENIEIIVDAIAIAVTTFVAFKIAVGAVRIGLVGYRFAVAFATKGTRAFNKAIKENPLGLLLSVLTAVIASLWDYGEATNDAEEGTDGLTEAQIRLKEESERLAAVISGKTLQEILQIIDTFGVAKLSVQQLEAALQELNLRIEDQASVASEAAIKVAKSFELIADEDDFAFQRRLANSKALQQLSAEEFNQVVQLVNARRDAFEVEDELSRRKQALENLEGGAAKEQLTRLQQINKELKENRKDREALLNTETDANSENFKSLEERFKALEREKKSLLDILNLKEEEFEQAKSADELIEEVDKKREEAAARRKEIAMENLQQELAVEEKIAKEKELIILNSGLKKEEIDKALLDNELLLLEAQLEATRAAGEETIDIEIEIAKKKKAIREKDLEDQKKIEAERRALINKGAQAGLNALQESINKQQELADDRISEIEDNITQQEKLAAQGLENTLAFEKRARAAAEAERKDLERKELQAEKVKSFYSLVGAYASQGQTGGSAIGLATRDFAIIEGITALFGEGGVVEDKYIETEGNSSNKHGRIVNGILYGASHDSPSKGIPILAEKEEGIFSKKEMRNLGKGNFYKLKSFLGKNVLNKDFFSNQQDSFNQVVNVTQEVDSSSTVQAIKSLERTLSKNSNGSVTAKTLGDTIEFIDKQVDRKINNAMKVRKRMS